MNKEGGFLQVINGEIGVCLLQCHLSRASAWVSQGSCFSLFSPKSMGRASAGRPEHASHAQHHCYQCQVCLGISFSCTFPYSGHLQAGLERGPHGKPSLARRKTYPGFWGARELLWGSQATQHVLQFSPYMAVSSFASSSPQADTCRHWHMTHDAAGQGMKCAQCTKSQPCPQGKDMHKNKEKQNHRVIRP